MAVDHLVVENVKEEHVVVEVAQADNFHKMAVAEDSLQIHRVTAVASEAAHVVLLVEALTENSVVVADVAALMLFARNRDMKTTMNCYYVRVKL